MVECCGEKNNLTFWPVWLTQWQKYFRYLHSQFREC